MSKKSRPPVALYSALADATRCRIVEILLAGPIPVHTLAAAFSISRPAISRHLRVLKTAGLVAEVKKGRENLYALRPQKLDSAKAWLETIRPGADQPAAEPEPIIVAEVPVAEPAPVPKATKPKKPKPAPIVVEIAAEPEAKPSKAKKPVPPPQPDINQMGFDF